MVAFPVGMPPIVVERVSIRYGGTRWAMAMPGGIGVVDTMIGFPHRDQMAQTYAFITRQTKDTQSREEFAFPVEYMFKQVPEKEIQTDDPVSFTLHQMDRWGIEKGMIGVGEPRAGSERSDGARALEDHPDRFIASAGCDPNEGMEGIRKLVRLHEAYGVRAVTAF